MTADQVLGALWRRRWVVLLVALGTFGVGAVVVMLLPSMYEATTVVRYDLQRPESELVQRTVGDLVEGRLLTVRQEILSRPVLQRAIEEMHLYPDIISSGGMDAAVEEMRKSLTVKIEGESAFELTVRAKDPNQAAKIANRLPQLFAEENVRVRTEQARRANVVFEDEIVRLKKSTADWEQKIAQFKVDHMGELPEQLETNMRGLERVAAAIAARTESLRIAEVRRSDMVRSNWSHESEPGRMEAAEQLLVQQLAIAEQTFTEDHPEVKRLRKEVEAMRKRRIDAEGRMVTEKQERARAVAQVSALQQELADLQTQASVFQKRLDATPKWAHQLTVMQRDYDIVRTKYQSLISRKVEAELAQDLEIRNARGLYNVVSPAVVPSAPAKPDRLGGFLISLLLSLALGALAGVLRELRDDSIRDTAMVKQSLPVPILAVVPQMTGRTERRVLVPARQQAINTTGNIWN